MMDNTIAFLEQALLKAISNDAVEEWIERYAIPFKELMAYYKCAIMRVETKFKVLNENFSLMSDSNPIENIESRLKSPKSIVDKMIRYNIPFTVDSIEKNLHDVAGVRVTCSYLSNIYELEEALLNQDDVTLIQRKDYIENPKPNGYRSLHLIISVPIFLQKEKKEMMVELQLRTLAMDTWASFEHKIRYKKQNGRITDGVSAELLECANLCTELDKKMEHIKSIAHL